jgi:hypothetical protein
MFEKQAVTYFKELSRNFSEGTTENPDKLQSGQSSVLKLLYGIK